MVQYYIMKKFNIVFIFLLLLLNISYAVTWDNCIEKYSKAKQFSEQTKLMYIYLKSTKNCLINFKNSLINKPNPEFTIEAMTNNIKKIDNYLNELIPKYEFPENNLKPIPKYLYTATIPILNDEYNYFKKFKNCNAVHAGNKIYTAKHCDIKKSQHIKYDLSYIPTKKESSLKVSNLNMSKLGTFKYYSMSKLGMFYGVLLKEEDCNFYKAKINPKGITKKIDIVDLKKEFEIRSSCLAIPSNSGGGVFQNEKLVGIISKTVFNENKFLYSVIEPIIPMLD